LRDVEVDSPYSCEPDPTLRTTEPGAKEAAKSPTIERVENFRVSDGRKTRR